MTERAVLFDLDGTFADTAPDLAGALDRLRAEQGLEPVPLERVRPFASAGARGLLRAGLDLGPEDAEYVAAREAFLAYYEEKPFVRTRLFPGIAELLRELAARRILWGIVTNKATRFTEPIVVGLGVEPACVVCGDTTPHTKPRPEPLLHAASMLGVPPAACWYVGDDLRDIQAARAAGMRACAVEWGYHHPERGLPASWQADVVISHPAALLEHL